MEGESRWDGPLRAASDRAWRILAVLALAAVVAVIGVSLAAIVVPALLAVVVVPVGRPLFEILGRRLPRSVAAGLVLVLAAAALGAASWLMMASIVANWDALWSGITDAIAAVTKWIDEQVQALTDEQIATMQENLRDLAGSISSVLVGGATRGVAVIGSFFVGLFLFLVTFFFGVRDWERFERWAVASMRPALRAQGEEFLERFDTVLRRYWRGQAFIGVFDAVAVGLGLAVIGVPLAVPIAILTFVLSFIPYVGAIVSTAIAVFVALGTAGTGDAVLALALCLFTFNTGENLMRPWLVGESMRMPTFVAFIAGTAGVLVAGPLGAILAIPLVALVGEAKRIFLPTASIVAGRNHHSELTDPAS